MFTDIEEQIKQLVQSNPNIQSITLEVDSLLYIFWTLKYKNNNEYYFNEALEMLNFIDAKK